MKMLMFSTNSMKYIWYLPQKVNILYIPLFSVNWLVSPYFRFKFDLNDILKTFNIIGYWLGVHVIWYSKYAKFVD